MDDHVIIGRLRGRGIFGAAIVVAVAALGVATAAPSYAVPLPPDHLNVDFTASGYTVADQSPRGENGWWYDSRTAPNYDYALVNDSDFPASGLPVGVSLRFSNAKAPSSQVIGQLITPYVTAAGETASGAAYNTFSTSYTIASATGGYQDGLALEVNVGHATDRSAGELLFRHVDGGLEIGTIWMPSDGVSGEVAAWRSARIQGPLPGGLWNPNVPHTVSTVTHFVDDGPDQTDVTIDGTLAAVVPTWEYYSALSSSTPKTATNMVFRVPTSAPSADGSGYQTGIPTVPATEGKGYLISGIDYGSSETTNWTPAAPTTDVPAAASETALAPTEEIPSTAIANTADRDYTLDLGPSFANEYVAVYAYSTPTLIGWFLADGSGVVSFTVPDTLAAGTHTIAAYDGTGALVGWVGGVTVAAVTGGTTVVDPGGPELAFTGADSGPWFLGGALLVLAGMVLTVTARRRREHQHR
ncbi:MAG TPA: hypothetical protein VGC18_04140 [Lacisediminihabitans sp.]|uniref:hypothetical protein n=1 Tax=Lacisediminihabitans sp. TaxID=2787631 RepID=UPI002EDA9766